jgi:hypothetical protein
MKCPLCQVEMRITRSRNILENDNDPDIPTKLFVVQEVSCMNKDCANYGKVVDSVKNELPIG